MTKYTAEYVAQKRAEMQANERHDNEAGWITPQEYYELLDEIERLQKEVKELQDSERNYWHSDRILCEITAL